MYRFFTLLILIFCLCYGCTQNTGHTKNIVRKGNNNNVDIEIPDDWIEKLRHFDYSRNTKPLLREFENIIKPDTLDHPNTEHIDEDYGRVLNALFVDLDGEPGDELICLLGWDVSSPNLCVFKEIQRHWHLIYMETIDTFYGAPTLSVANCFSKNKTFYLRRVYDHGSGVYEDGYSFYKLINNKVYHCLELVNEARIYGWGLYMNQEVKMNFEFNGDNRDEIGVDYTYNFFPGAINKGDCSWCANVDVSLIKGDSKIWYAWDNKSMTYKLDLPSYKGYAPDLDDLTAKKIACFGAFGNDTLFVDAFNDQINEILKTGTRPQKKILTKYLARVIKDRTAITERIEKKSEAGRTSFYGPAKAK